jgi:multidrug efflux pump subunit AcrB
MQKLVSYFLHRPIIANALLFGILFSAVFAWKKIGKEEMPDYTLESLSMTIRYSGASAEDVELFITKPVEEKLKGVTSLREVFATSSYGVSSIRINFEPKTPDLVAKIQEVKDAVESVDFPSEVRTPIFRQFKSTEKAIIDIGLYLKGVEILSIEQRQLLQSHALGIKNKLLALPEISAVDISGYLKPELQIKVRPELLRRYEISMGQVKTQISAQNVRHPIGMMRDRRETEVTLVSELNNPADLQEVTLSAGFQGQKLKLKDLAVITEGFEKSNIITKVQGHEGLVLDIQKSASTDILKAQSLIVKYVEEFQRNNPDSPVGFVLMDDESYDVRNRLELIASNGLIGFILILLVLFLFLDLRSGVWVAMGIPFSLACTVIMANLLGFTVNNMTLAAVIIVLGIVVDDAIIIAENITRKNVETKDNQTAKAVSEVGAPVLASMLTTCAAFVPLYFFSGRFGLFVKVIPTVIFLILTASLLESFFLLPAHMAHETWFERMARKIYAGNGIADWRERFVRQSELFYSKFLQSILNYHLMILTGFVVLLAASAFIFHKKMKYVMFPREESRDFRLQVIAAPDTKRYEMAQLVRKVEDIFLLDKRGIVTSVRTSIGQNRRGGEVRENEASVHVEIVSASERKVSFQELSKEWEKQAKELNLFEEIKLQKNRFGSDSGSPIALEIQENNDEIRSTLVAELKLALEKIPELTNVEIQKPVTKHEYRLEIDKDKTARLGINFEQLGTTLRSYIEGDILYVLNNGDEEIDVRFTSNDDSKDDVNKLLELTVANGENYLVPIKNLVRLIEQEKPSSIQRVNFKRATQLYADFSREGKVTPLEMAEIIEREVFPQLLKNRPSSNILFRGEVQDSREAKSDFTLSVVLVLGLIYLLLIFLFDSFTTPLLIAAIIPFGVVGTILAFWVHGMSQYGFFAVVGTLGMVGVVINDSIVLIDRLDNHLKEAMKSNSNLSFNISEISASRLRPICITTITTVAGLLPTAYGIGGYDSMLAEMMLAMAWGLSFGLIITLIMVPCLYLVFAKARLKV